MKISKESKIPHLKQNEISALIANICEIKRDVLDFITTDILPTNKDLFHDFDLVELLVDKGKILIDNCEKIDAILYYGKKNLVIENICKSESFLINYPDDLNNNININQYKIIFIEDIDQHILNKIIKCNKNTKFIINSNLVNHDNSPYFIFHDVLFYEFETLSLKNLTLMTIKLIKSFMDSSNTNEERLLKDYFYYDKKDKRVSIKDSITVNNLNQIIKKNLIHNLLTNVIIPTNFNKIINILISDEYNSVIDNLLVTNTNLKKHFKVINNLIKLNINYLHDRKIDFNNLKFKLEFDNSKQDSLTKEASLFNKNNLIFLPQYKRISPTLLLDFIRHAEISIFDFKCSGKKHEYFDFISKEISEIIVESKPAPHEIYLISLYLFENELNDESLQKFSNLHPTLQLLLILNDLSLFNKHSRTLYDQNNPLHFTLSAYSNKLKKNIAYNYDKTDFYFNYFVKEIKVSNSPFNIARLIFYTHFFNCNEYKSFIDYNFLNNNIEYECINDLVKIFTKNSTNND